MAKTKVTVKMHEKLFESFEKQIDALHIKRDAFLDSVIQQEMKFLEEELGGRRQSPAARQYIAGELKRLGTRKVNIQIEQSTADKLNRIVREGNLVRDAFVNRLVMFLRSTPMVLKALGLPSHITGSEYDDYVEPMPTSPLAAIQVVQSDPLYYIRAAIQERHQVGLYELLMPEKLIGFSCYLDDNLVPGTKAYLDAQEFTDMFFSLGEETSGNSDTHDKKGGAS